MYVASPKVLLVVSASAYAKTFDAMSSSNDTSRVFLNDFMLSKLTMVLLCLKNRTSL